MACRHADLRPVEPLRHLWLRPKPRLPADHRAVLLGRDTAVRRFAAPVSSRQRRAPRGQWRPSVLSRRQNLGKLPIRVDHRAAVRRSARLCRRGRLGGSAGRAGRGVLRRLEHACAAGIQAFRPRASSYPLRRGVRARAADARKLGGVPSVARARGLGGRRTAFTDPAIARRVGGRGSHVCPVRRRGRSLRDSRPDGDPAELSGD